MLQLIKNELIYRFKQKHNRSEKKLSTFFVAVFFLILFFRFFFIVIFEYIFASFLP